MQLFEVLSWVREPSPDPLYVADGGDVVGQKMFKDFSLGLRPSIGYRLNRHWQIGVEGYIGLTNIFKEYGYSTGSEHLHCIVATVGYIF